MEWFKGGKVEDIIFLRLDYGDDIHACVEEVAKKEDIQTGVIVSAIGTVDKARMHSITHTDFPPHDDQFSEVYGPIEVAGIHGIIADYKPHMHFTFYDYLHRETKAGHLEPGCRSLYLCELVILKIKGVSLTRISHPETKVMQLKEKKEEK
ncbi:DNA-binding protein [Candidatus Aerophobetes bacterium]|nr:DNA-binding protein [Candidatus Aerophobetes bacterium]